MLTLAGAVIGIDVGFSLKKRSSAICRLEWHENELRWTIARFKAVEPERATTIANVASTPLPVIAAAFDGPLRRGLDVIGRYRVAEQMLTKGMAAIGKPGQSSSPIGKLLNHHTNVCANHLLNCATIGQAGHEIAIHELAIVEAFPSTFLGLLLPDPSLFAPKRGDRSDLYFASLASGGTIAALLNYFLPGRAIPGSITHVQNHDDRAAFVCALTALCIAAGDYTAVGDVVDGWIILPPKFFISAWGWAVLEANAGRGPAGLYVARQPTVIR